MERWILGGVRSNSRKGKKNSCDRPKQPQRGLGVSQLEKIRLHAQMGYSQNPSFQTHVSSNYNNEDGGMQSAYSSLSSSSSFLYSTPSSSSSFLYSTPSSSSSSHGFYPSIMLGEGDHDQKSYISYGDSQSTAAERWSPNSGIVDSQHYSMEPNMSLSNPHI